MFSHWVCTDLTVQLHRAQTLERCLVEIRCSSVSIVKTSFFPPPGMTVEYIDVHCGWYKGDSLLCLSLSQPHMQSKGKHTEQRVHARISVKAFSPLWCVEVESRNARLRTRGQLKAVYALTDVDDSRLFHWPSVATGPVFVEVELT